MTEPHLAERDNALRPCLSLGLGRFAVRRFDRLGCFGNLFRKPPGLLRVQTCSNCRSSMCTNFTTSKRLDSFKSASKAGRKHGPTCAFQSDSHLGAEVVQVRCCLQAVAHRAHHQLCALLLAGKELRQPGLPKACMSRSVGVYGTGKHPPGAQGAP